MDNLDAIIRAALKDNIKPDAAFVDATVRMAASVQKKEERSVINVIFISNLLLIAALLFSAMQASPAITFLVYCFCLTWLCALITLFVLAKDKLKNSLKGEYV